MKRVLITGAGSYVGTAVRERLEREPERFQVDELDVKDHSWCSVSFESYDSVFHVAAIVHKVETAAMEELYMSVNRDLAIELASKAKADGVKQFIFMSTAAVYGSGIQFGPDNPITEETPLNPQSLYGKSKALAERGLEELDGADFNVAILRCPMVYGPCCQNGNFPKLEEIAKKVIIFPDIENYRSMLYIGNLAELVTQLIVRKAGGLFLPQNAHYVQTTDMVRKMGKAYGRNIIFLKSLRIPIKALIKAGHRNAQKAFGDYCYSQKCSSLPFEYRPYSFEASIIETTKTKS